MRRITVGIFYDPWARSYATNEKGYAYILARLEKALASKANPRSKEYMRALFEEKCPGSRFVEVEADSSWQEEVRSADNIVLLYPDAIGQGFGDFELSLVGLMKERANLSVLNGRKREFALCTPLRRELRFRRILERWMLVESVVLVLFLLLTPPLLAWDLARGRR